MIQQNLNRIKSEIGAAKLIAVSKYRSIEELTTLYNSGQRIMAENRVQELLRKKPELPSDIEWHLIGHLQTNKVKSIIEEVSLIHSADRIKLLDEIEKQAQKRSIRVSVLLQVHVAQEESKFGFPVNELIQLAESGHFSRYQHIDFNGIMSMASLTSNENQVTTEFDLTQTVFKKIKPHMPAPDQFIEVSMGMSSDYFLALESGATMVRIGSKLFA
ncbi:MAG: YggS family pyridoxal phosphate-dependent enzyme [Bacteroidia bacterium]|nr:YggS family pyridoxal phosphate-dependent enzyme [Bacteroidia bacterium]